MTLSKFRQLVLISIIGMILAGCGPEGGVTNTEGTSVTREQADTSVTTTSGFDAEEYFAGETIRIIVGFSPGGGFDTYSRLLARHLPEHIPGNPSVIVENMPGAGGLVAAGHIQDQVEPDGLTFGTFGNFALQQAVGDPTLPIDITQYQELGDLFPEPASCLIRSDVASSLEELAGASEIQMADTAANTSSALISVALREFLGVSTSLVTGYPGSGEIQLAVERGEVDGYCSSVGSMLQDAEAMLEAGDGFIFTYVSAEPLGDQFEELPDEIWIANLADDEDTKELMSALASAARGYHKHYAAPVDTPPEVVDVLRTAIEDTANDPDFLAEAEQQGRLVDFLTGEQVEERISAALNLPQELKEFVAGVLLEQ